MRLTTLAAQPAASGGKVEKSIPPFIQAVVSLLLVFQRRFLASRIFPSTVGLEKSRHSGWEMLQRAYSNAEKAC